MRVDVNGKNVNVPEEFIERTMKSLDVDRAEAVRIFLDDEGFTTNDEIVAMSAKAKAAGSGLKATGEKKERKAPVRKPDEVKRAIIAALAEFIETTDGAENVNVTNIERMIAFSIGSDNFEVTLTKKRPAKN
jgi:predicted RNA-binding protein Jag